MQPIVLVPVTVYVVEVVGSAITIESKPRLSDHAYVLAPLTVKVMLSPLQIVDWFEEAEITN